jgi:hypothetical protein
LVSGYYFPTWRIDVWFASIAAIPLIGDVLRYTISPISSWLALPLFAKKLSHRNQCRKLSKMNIPG